MVAQVPGAQDKRVGQLGRPYDLALLRLLHGDAFRWLHLDHLELNGPAFEDPKNLHYPGTFVDTVFLSQGRVEFLYINGSDLLDLNITEYRVDDGGGVMELFFRCLTQVTELGRELIFAAQPGHCALCNAHRGLLRLPLTTRAWRPIRH